MLLLWFTALLRVGALRVNLRIKPGRCAAPLLRARASFDEDPFTTASAARRRLVVSAAAAVVVGSRALKASAGELFFTQQEFCEKSDAEMRNGIECAYGAEETSSGERLRLLCPLPPQKNSKSDFFHDSGCVVSQFLSHAGMAARRMPPARSAARCARALWTSSRARRSGSTGSGRRSTRRAHAGFARNFERARDETSAPLNLNVETGSRDC